MTLYGARKARGMTQEGLAAVVGVTRQSISAYELGKADPTLTVYRRLCAALGYDELEVGHELAGETVIRDDWRDDASEVGYDPYMGCTTNDC